MKTVREFMSEHRRLTGARRIEAWLAARRWCFLQGDQNAANQAGASYRADMNNELQALVSNSSGASAPSTTYAYQYWADTTNGLLKQRNAANSSWLVRATLKETFAISRSSNTILAGTDFGGLIKATSTFTQTLTAAATLGDGWYIQYRNDSTGIITIDPNASETIDGATTIYLYPGEGCVIYCDGANFKTVGRGTGLIKITGATASSSATIDITTGITSDFDEYLLTITDYLPATDATELWLRVSEDAGSTFKAGGTDYLHSRNVTISTTNSAAGSTGDAKIIVDSAMSATTTSPVSGEIRFWNPSGTSKRKLFGWKLDHLDSGGALRTVVGSGLFNLDSNAINAIRLLSSSGNIASGTFALYGVRK